MSWFQRGMFSVASNGDQTNDNLHRFDRECRSLHRSQMFHYHSRISFISTLRWGDVQTEIEIERECREEPREMAGQILCCNIIVFSIAIITCYWQDVRFFARVYSFSKSPSIIFLNTFIACFIASLMLLTNMLWKNWALTSFIGRWLVLRAIITWKSWGYVLAKKLHVWGVTWALKPYPCYTGHNILNFWGLSPFLHIREHVQIYFHIRIPRSILSEKLKFCSDSPLCFQICVLAHMYLFETFLFHIKPLGAVIWKHDNKGVELAETQE